MAGKAPQGFYKRGTRWWIRTDPVTGRAVSTGCTDLEAAKRWRRQRERLAADPNYAAEADEGINHWAMKLLEMKRRHRAAGTVHFYTKKLGHIVRFFGASAPVSSMLPARWDAYVAQRQDEGASNHTIAKEIKVAEQIAKLAKRSGVFHGDPSTFKPPDFSANYEPRDRFLTPEELAKLSAKLTPKRLAWVAANIAFGARFSEVLRARPEDVDTEAWTVRIRGTKTKKADAVIPIAEPFRGLVLVALPFLPLEPWANMVRDLAAACRRAGIQRVTSNDLRRTHGTWLEELGVPHSAIAKVLRHTSETMVRLVYGRARPEKLGQAIQALINATKTLQEAPETAGTDPQNPSKVQVAQSVEQWIENPHLPPDARTENRRAGGNPSHIHDSDSAAGCRPVRWIRSKNVTAELRPRPPRKAVREMAARLRSEALAEESLLDAAGARP